MVASDAGGNGELIADGETGFLVPSGSVEETARAIERTLADPTDATRMARRGRERVLAEFTTEAMIEKTDLYYRRLYEIRQ